MSPILPTEVSCYVIVRHRMVSKWPFRFSAFSGEYRPKGGEGGDSRLSTLDSRLPTDRVTLMPIQSTFVMVKPDGVRRGLVGDVISRLERKGLHLEAMRMLTMDRELASEHYAEHVDRPFFGDLVEFITGGPVVVMRWSGESAVTVARTLMGETNPVAAQPGTIRGDLGLELTQNIVHGSDAAESAERELALFFE